MKSLKIGDLEIKIPIIQGGMGVGISLSGLASAVANQGGVGVIATVGIGLLGNKPYKNYKQANIDSLIAEIKKARNLTVGVLGVNIMVALTNYADLVTASVNEGIDIIFSGAGLPLDLPKYLNKDSKTKLVPIVSSGRATNIICNKWHRNYNYLPDAIVVEGPKAGGHLGFKKEQIENEDFQLEKLIPEVLAVTKSFEEKYSKPIPVIAAGGIYTGEDIYKFIQMGASGVQMGTRFVATKECDASDSFKQLYLDSTESDICIIESPVGLPGRAIVRSYLDNANKGIARPINCKYHCISTCDYKHSLYCIADALLQAQMGNLDDGFAFAGSNAYRVNEIITVEELFNILVSEYEIAAGKTV